MTSLSAISCDAIAPVCLFDDDRVWRNAATDDRLAQTPCRVDHQFVARARHRIRGEEHASDLGRNQLLHDDGDADVFRPDPLSLAVADRAPRPQRRPAPLDCMDHFIAAAHVEVRFQLARERHARQIFRRCRRAHRHGSIGAQLAIPLPYHFGDIAGYRALCDERLDLLRRAVERGRVVGLLPVPRRTESCRRDGSHPHSGR